MTRARSTVRAHARALTRAAALLGIASAQVWCATNDDSTSTPPPEPTPDGSTIDAPRSDEDSTAKPPVTCTAALCRVPLAGAEAVALNGIFARGASDVWVVGSSGFAAHFDGSAWKPITTKTNQSLFAVWGDTDGPVWGTSAGSSFFMLDRASAEGGAPVVDGGWTSIVTAISGISSGESYAVGSVSTDDPFGGDPTVGDNIWRHVPALPGTDAGPSWKPVSPACTFFGPQGCVVLRAVWMQSAQIQWFAGDDGKVYRTDTSDAGPTDAGKTDAGKTDGGAASSRLRLVETSSSSLRTLEGLWGFGADDVWAVGAQGTIRHWKGDGSEAWEIVPSPVTVNLHGVWGARADDVWAVGDDGVVLHWDGKSWSLVPTPFGESHRPRLYAVSGTGRDVWIAGESTLLRSVAGGSADGGAP